MHHRRQWQVLQVAVAGADACAIALAFTLVFLLSLDPQGAVARPHVLAWRVLHISIYIVGWMILLAIYRLYEPEYLLDGLQQYTRIAQASTAGLLIIGLDALLDGSALISRSWLLASWLLSILSLGITRFLARRIVRHLRCRGLFRSRLLIVGAGEDGLAIADQIAGAASNAAEVVGFLDEYSALGAPVGNRGEVLGEPLALARVARDVDATDAIIVPQAISWESLQVLMQGRADDWGVQRLWLSPALRDLLTTGMEVHLRGSLPLLSVSGPRITGVESVLKRSLDLAVVLAVLPVALPLCLVIALWLRLVRGATPLACQRVIGRNRREFTLLTFPPTPGLRRLHLWRLPALINVLVGNLSLVGPRPIARSLGIEYRPWQLMLASVRPGLTGPWWLLSGSGRLAVEAEVGLDLGYIRGYTIWLDIRLLALTTWRVLTRPGAEQTVPGPLDGSPAATSLTPTATPAGGAL